MTGKFKNKSTTEEIRKRFDNDVERFSDLETGQKATVDAPVAMELITRAALACNPNPSTVLDIGCGAGNNTLKLLQHRSPLDCTLVDLSRPMLDRAVERICKANTGRIRDYQEDFRYVELPNDHYDIVFAAAVLHHLRSDEDWENVFRKIYEVTAPGGSVWITDLVSHENSDVHDLMWNRYGEYLKLLGGEQYRERVFEYIDKEDTPRPVTFQMELLRKSGFSQVDILHKNSCFASFGAVKL